MDLKNLFSQFLGSVGTAANYKPGQSPSITDPFQRLNLQQPRNGSDIQTMELRNQQGQFPLAGGYAGMLDPIKGITDPNERRFLMDQIANERAFGMMDNFTRGREQRDMDSSLKLIERLREQQYADRLKSRPLEFQELVATNLLKTITDLPGQVVRAGRMYDKEALEAGAELARRPGFQETIRYFA